MAFKPLELSKRSCPNCFCYRCAWRDACEYCAGRRTAGCEYKTTGTELGRTKCDANNKRIGVNNRFDCKNEECACFNCGVVDCKNDDAETDGACPSCNGSDGGSELLYGCGRKDIFDEERAMNGKENKMNLPIKYDDETKSIIKELLSAVSRDVVLLNTTADEKAIYMIKQRLAEVMSALEREDYLYPMKAIDFEIKIEFAFPDCECTIIPANNRTFEFFDALKN